MSIVSPFGITGESFENPVYPDKMIDTLGGESIPSYEKKVQCYGGALAFSEPEKSQEMVKGIIELETDSPSVSGRCSSDRV